jgi:AcrR family transcriptional regulator
MSSFEVHFCAVKRKYELKRRAARQAETRNRIVEATVGLHTTFGPARTTISEIAHRAGVQRHTVYAHFRGERTLFDACSAHWASRHPIPDASGWSAVADPEERLRAALDALYAWYEGVEHDIAVFERDALVHEVTAGLVARRHEAIRSLVQTVLGGWPRRKAVRAAIGHAFEFETWRSLVRRQGLTRAQAVDTMLSLARSI